MDEDSWKETTDVFAHVWEEKYPGLECCVQVDNLAAHKSVEVTVKLLAKGIRFLWPPAGTSTFLQPLDDILFGALKKALSFVN